MVDAIAFQSNILAQRSASAAKEILTLISNSVDQVGAGRQRVQQAGAAMNEIVEGITRVANIMSGIASASAEKTTGIGQVNAAIAQMDDVTQQDAALVEEAAAAARSLEHQAASLSQLVSTFKLDGDASKTSRRPCINQVRREDRTPVAARPDSIKSTTPCLSTLYTPRSRYCRPTAIVAPAPW